MPLAVKGDLLSGVMLKERQRRLAYIRHLCPEDQEIQKEGPRARRHYIALHHFHPTIVQQYHDDENLRMLKVPSTITETQVKELELTVHKMDRLRDENDKPLEQFIFPPSYEWEKAREDVKCLSKMRRMVKQFKKNIHVETLRRRRKCAKERNGRHNSNGTKRHTRGHSKPPCKIICLMPTDEENNSRQIRSKTCKATMQKLRLVTASTQVRQTSVIFTRDHQNVKLPPMLLTEYNSLRRQRVLSHMGLFVLVVVIGIICSLRLTSVDNLLFVMNA